MINERIITFPSEDGVNTISAKIWVKADSEPKAVLQMVHGMVEHKGRYNEFARFMAEQGFLVCMHDQLGHGDSVKNSGDLGYISEKASSDYLIGDIHNLRMIIEKEYPDLKLIMLGHSMGSYLLRKYLTMRGERVMGAVVMGTGYELGAVTSFGLMLCKILAKFKGWRYRCDFIRQMTYTGPYKGYDLTGKNPENSWLSRNTENVIEYYEDPKCAFLFTLAGYKALFEAVKFSCSRKNAAKIRKDLPILLISGEEDPVGARGKGVRRVENLYKSVGMKYVTMKLYPDARHELLNEINREEVYKEILNWMEVVKIQQSRWRKWDGKPAN